MAFQLTREFIEKIELLIEYNNSQEILIIFNNILAPDIAEVLQTLSFDHSKHLFSLFNEEKSAEILIELDEEIREKFIDNLSSKEIVNDLINNLESDDAVDVIQELTDKKQQEVLSNITNPQQASDIADLLSYDDNSAGALMAKELIKVSETWSILRCVSEMRKQAKNVNSVYTIYVINDNNQLVGTLSLKRILLTHEKTFIEKIYNKQVISVQTNASGEAVANLMNKYDLIVLPVVNDNDELVGRITIDDVVDFIKEEAEKDYQMASGISDNVESFDSILTITKARIPWLIIGMIGGIIGAQIIGIFNVEQYPTYLVFFIPLIAAMGGNVGVQSSAIIVQALATQNLGLDNWLNRFMKELGVSLLNGLICCILVFFICKLIYPDPNLPIIVSLSLLTVMVFAALFGTFVPLILNKYRIDPALATGPFITTINDVIGLIIYFSIAKIII
jgi:magnesium transporter